MFMNNRYWRLLAIFLLPFTLAACATKQVPLNFNPEEKGKDGVVAFSVTHDVEGGRGNNAIVYLNNPDGRGIPGLELNFESSDDRLLLGIRKSDYRNVYGYLYVISLPPGDHSFTGWQISNGTGLRIYPSEEPPPQTFHIDAGEIKYLGNFHGNLVRGKNIFGATITGGGVVSLNDEQVRDMELLIARYPQFSGKVTVDLFRPGQWVNTVETSSATDIPFQVPVTK